MTVRSARRSHFAIAASVAMLAAILTSPSYAAGPGPAAQPASPAHQPMKPAKDRTPPAPVTGLTMTGNDAQSISLTWTNPREADFAGVLIRRSNTSSPPISAKDGVLVAALNARQATFTDSSLTAGHRYSYAVFTRDKTRNVGVPATLSAATRTRNTATGVRGKVTDQEGRPIKNVFVEIREVETDDFMAWTRTSSNGQFLATGLTAGTYRICYLLPPDASGHSNLGYRPACYRQQLDGPGTPVVVQAGKITSGLVDYLHVAGAISGRVTDSAGQGLANVSVTAYGTEWWHGRAAVTGPDGTYTVTGLVEDTYGVCFTRSAGTSPTGYLDECYDNQPTYYPDGTSTPVLVTLGQISSGIDAALEAAGAITGRVTDGNGVPLVGVAFSYSRDALVDYTDSNGSYTIKGLATGSYFLCFDGSQVTSTTAPYGYTNSCDAGGAYADITAGQVTTLNERLEAAGAIGGTARGDDGPLAGVWVQVTNSSYTVARYATTDWNGSYRLTGLPPGEVVTVCFDPTYSTGGYLRACYGDETGSATPVTIGSGQLSTADIQLQRGALITGTVTDSSGAPIADVILTVTDTGNEYYSAVTDESGNYTLGGLVAGSYRICFDPSYARGPAAGGYVSECYDNQPSGETADPVAVGGPSSVTVVNAVLSPGAAITGRVTGSDGAALEGVYVTATAVDGDLFQVAITRYDGSYTVRNVSEGDYSLCFDAPDTRQPSATGYVNECFDDTAPSTSYTVVHVAASSTTTGIDAVLAVGAKVTGHVTDAAGIGIPSVPVQVARADGSYLVNYGYTDGNGRYEITGLPAIAVKLCFMSTYGAHLSECYDNQPDVSTATLITLSSGLVRAGVDAVLADAPH